MANTQRVLSLSRNYAYKPHNPITSLQVMGPEELRLCRVMKNALLRRKTRRKTGRPHKQPSPATTWQPTWLLSVAALVALCVCLILNCQEFTTHQHLSDIEEWIGHAYTHFTVNDAAGTIVLLRAMYGTLRCATRWKRWNFPRWTSLRTNWLRCAASWKSRGSPRLPSPSTRVTTTPATLPAKQRRTRTRKTRIQASDTAPDTFAQSLPADLGDDCVRHGSYPYGASHTLGSAIIALLIGYMTYAVLNTHDAWGFAVLSGWMANDLLGTRAMRRLVVRLAGYTRSANTSTSEHTETAPFTFCTTGGAYCQVGDVTLATPESALYAGARCLLAYIRCIPMQLVTGVSTTLAIGIQCSIRLLYWMQHAVLRGHIWFILTARGRALSVPEPAIPHTPCEAPRVTPGADVTNLGYTMTYTMVNTPASARAAGEQFARSAGIVWDDGPPKLLHTAASPNHLPTIAAPGRAGSGRGRRPLATHRGHFARHNHSGAVPRMQIRHICMQTGTSVLNKGERPFFQADRF